MESSSCFLFDTATRSALYSGQMVCGALWRTVSWLRQRLRRGCWIPGHISIIRALDSTPCDVEIWPGNRADWLNKQEQADERNSHEYPPSQTTPACPRPGQHDSDDHLAFPM